ncbi:MAG: MFS transporter [Clostridia bacterium]|nr:MFS transporter [Clostridia bacterium]
MFFSSLYQTVVATAMPTIISELRGFDLYTWLFTAYILASAATVPIYGRLSDTYGRKPFYLFGLAMFLVGSALCGFSQSMGQLIAARVVQGVGGGAMMSMPRATIGDIFNPRERGRWMGLMMGVFGLASLVGPAMGGWITDHLGWRWVFFVSMPVALVALAMVAYALPTVRRPGEVQVDWLGSLLLVGSLVAMLLGFTWGGSTYAWSSPEEASLFLAAALGLGLFILNERRTAFPVIELSIFRNRTFVSTMVISLFLMMSMFSAMLFLPIFVQGVLGLSAENSGYLMTPMMLAFIAGSLASGLLMSRTGRYKWQAVGSGALLVLGAYLLTRLTADSTWPEVVRDMIVMGVGVGALMPVMGTVIQNIFPYRIMGTVNAAQQTVTSLAGAIAAPIFGGVMANHFAARFREVLPPDLAPALAHLGASGGGVGGGSGAAGGLGMAQSLVSAEAQKALADRFAAFGPQGQALYQEFIRAVHVALADATAQLYELGLAFAVAAFLTTFFLREVRLRHEEYYHEEDAGVAP